MKTSSPQALRQTSVGVSATLWQTRLCSCGPAQHPPTGPHGDELAIWVLLCILMCCQQTPVFFFWGCLHAQLRLVEAGCRCGLTQWIWAAQCSIEACFGTVSWTFH